MGIETTERGGILHVVLTGPWPTVQEFREARERAIASGQLTDDTLELLDVRDVVGRLPRADDIEVLGSKFTHPPKRRAFLVASDVQFGVGRMAGVVLKDAPRVFRDEARAIAWLKNPTG